MLDEAAVLSLLEEEAAVLITVWNASAARASVTKALEAWQENTEAGKNKVAAWHQWWQYTDRKGPEPNMIPYDDGSIYYDEIAGAREKLEKSFTQIRMVVLAYVESRAKHTGENVAANTNRIGDRLCKLVEDSLANEAELHLALRGLGPGYVPYVCHVL